MYTRKSEVSVLTSESSILETLYNLLDLSQLPGVCAVRSLTSTHGVRNTHARSSLDICNCESVSSSVLLSYTPTWLSSSDTNESEDGSDREDFAEHDRRIL